jgi:hypothetical protein
VPVRPAAQTYVMFAYLYGAASVASFQAAVFTEISLCDVCSCHEILRAQRTRVGEDSLQVSYVSGNQHYRAWVIPWPDLFVYARRRTATSAPA